MITKEILSIVITVLIAVLGWLIGHYFSSQRDRRNKRREIITNHLIAAYRILANDITRRKFNDELVQKIEHVISEIQLFGSKSQVDLAIKLALDVQRGGTFYLDDLLNDLRNSLRKELELQKIEGNITWLRLNEDREFVKSFDKKA